MSDGTPTSSTVIASLFGLITAGCAYLFKQFRDRIEAIEQKVSAFVPRDEIAHAYANKEHIAALELRIAELASRRELVAYMAQQSENAAKMHTENRETFSEIRDTFAEQRVLAERREQEAQKFRHDIREAINAVALKLETVATIQKERGK